MCTAGSRIFVQESIYDKFMKGFVTIAQSIQQGDGFKAETHQGPSVSEAQMKVCRDIVTNSFSRLIGLTACFGLH